MLRKLTRLGRATPAVAVIAVGLVPTAPATAIVLTPATIGGLRTVVAGSAPTYLGTARSLGVASATAPARALIALQHRDQAGLLRFIARVSNPRSRLYEHYLTPAQFVARYAPKSSTVASVEAFGRSYGLHIQSVPSNRAYVYVTGTVGAMDQAFRTTIERFSLNGTTVQAPTTALSIPARFAGVITGIDGLDTGDVAHPRDALATPPAPAFVNAPPMANYWGQLMATQAPGAYGQTVLPDVVKGYTPQQLQSAYGTAKAIAHGLNGAGQTVAVIDAYSSPTLLTDLTTWSSRHRLPAPKLTIFDNAAERDQPEGPAVDGINLQDPQGWFGEETLDVEAVHAMAPGAAIVAQSATSPLNVDLEMAQNQVVANKEAQIVSNSYGGSSDTTDTTSDGYWQQAAAEGIGVYFSSGDNGDETSGGASPANRATDGGSNSPYVTGVGGTTLAFGVTQSARTREPRYLFETYWGTDTASLTNGAWGQSTWQSGGGGGTSEVYGEPAYQTPVVPGRFANYWQNNSNAASGALIPGRVVPDVAILGDPNSGFLMGQTQDFTAFSNPDGYDLPTDTIAYGEYRIGGTSLSSPLFAGIMALADQAAGKPHGFANPALYQLYSTAAFRDITAPEHKVAVVRTNYTNNTEASGGTATFLRTAGDLVTLSSIKGYDDSTGLGSPNGLAFLSRLAPQSSAIRRIQHGARDARTRKAHRRRHRSVRK